MGFLVMLLGLMGLNHEVEKGCPTFGLPRGLPSDFSVGKAVGLSILCVLALAGLIGVSVVLLNHHHKGLAYVSFLLAFVIPILLPLCVPCTISSQTQERHRQERQDKVRVMRYLINQRKYSVEEAVRHAGLYAPHLMTGLILEFESWELLKVYNRKKFSAALEGIPREFEASS